MKIQLFSQTWKGMVKTSTFLLFSNVAMALTVAVLGMAVVNKEPVVTLVPPSLTKEARVGLNTADAEYFMSFGMYAATLTGNITPKNVVFVADAISTLVDAQIYPEVRRQMFALANDPVFKTRGGSIYFEPVDVQFDAPTGKVFVLGNQVSLTASGRQNRLPFVYEIQMEMRNRRPVITAFDKYAGRVAHTLEWEEKSKRQMEAAERRAARKRDESAGAKPWFEDSVRYAQDPELEQGNGAPEPFSGDEVIDPALNSTVTDPEPQSKGEAQ